MNIEQALEELDQLFATGQIEQVQGFLESKIAQAKEENDQASVITLYNEMIGYCRDTSKYEMAAVYCEEVIRLMQERGLTGTIPYATTLLNVANAYRAAGRLQESLTCYKEVFRLYEGNLEQTDFRYASLHNNLSLLYQEMGDYEKACEALRHALSIVVLYPEARIEMAVTYSNLAASLLKLDRQQEAMENLERAFAIFEQDEKKDYHYSAALSAMGEAKFRAGQLTESKKYYEKALQEIEKNVGKTQAYEITRQNLEQVRSRMEQEQEQIKEKELNQRKYFANEKENEDGKGTEPQDKNEIFEKKRNTPQKGLALCQAYYEQYGRPMIHEKFKAYKHQIAAGLVGEGSECFGFDDEQSRDHDWGPGFCIWLSDEVYAEIGQSLQEAYDLLPKEYEGQMRRETPQGRGRVGVFSIAGFYQKQIGLSDAPQTESDWLYLEDERLAAATNGAVFTDPEGIFTKIRMELKAYYPEAVRGKKVARECALFSQTGQYNFERMLARGERVTAQIALASFMEHTMKLVYLLNRRYAPFYKWLHRGMNDLPVLPEIMDILNAISDMELTDERIPQIIEILAKLLVAELNKQGLSSSQDTYLGHHMGLG